MTRLVGAAMAALIVGLTYRLGLAVSPPSLRGSTPVLASWIVATLPQTAILGGIVSNDLAVALMSSGVLLALVKGFAVSGPRAAAWRRAVLLGLPAAVLTKFHALALLPVALAAAASRRSIGGRTRLSQALLAVLLGLAAAGWVPMTGGTQAPLVTVGGTLRNLEASVVSGLDGPGRLIVGLMQSVRFAVLTFPGVFGWGLVQGPRYLYLVGAPALATATLVGMVLSVREREVRKAGLALGLFVVALIGLLYAYAFLGWQRDFEAHGRRLYTAVAAIAVLAGLALARLPRWLGWALPVVLLAAGTQSLVAVLPRELEPPPLAVSAAAQEPAARFGEEAAVYAPQVRQDPRASEVEVRFALEKTGAARDLALALTVDTNAGRVLARQQRYPGQGRLSLSRLPPGSVVEEVWRVRAPAGEELEVGRVWLSLFNFFGGETVAASDARGEPLGTSVLLGRFVLVPEAYRPLEPDGWAGAHFGEGLRLRGFETAGCEGPVVELRLSWEALRASVLPGLSVFVHALDAGGGLVGQADGTPAAGELPPEIWPPGVPIPDERSIKVERRAERLRVGFYQPWSGRRLPVVDAGALAAGPDYVELPCTHE